MTKPSLAMVGALSFRVMLVALPLQAAEPDGKTNQTLFSICREGKAECKLTIDTQAELKLAQQLQMYFYKLSRVIIPVEAYTYPDPQKPEDVSNAIEISTGRSPLYTGYCTVSFRRDKQGKLVGPPVLSRVSLVIEGHYVSSEDCALAVISNFVEKVFGPPLFAVDDPNYKWPKKTTLVIDADKFETIKYPPEKNEVPRYLKPPAD